MPGRIPGRISITPLDTEPLVGRPPGAILFHRCARNVTTAAFVHDALVLADTLPRGPMVNLCRDRYAFAVAFAAALLRGQSCLLTGDRSTAGLAALDGQFPDAFAAVDGDLDDSCDGRWQVCRVAPVGRAPSAPQAMPRIPSAQLAAVVFTSGSTGAPVAHHKLWGALVARSRAAAEPFALNEAAPSTIVGTVPPQHMYGFELTVLLPLHAPAASWCGPAFFPGDVHAALHVLPEPRILVTTPLQIRALLQGEVAPPPLQAVISATAPLDPVLALEAERRWSAPMLEIFGATEVGSIASRRTLESGEWTAYPGVSIRQARQEAGQEALVTTITAPWASAVELTDIIELLGNDRFRLLGRRTDLVKLGGRRASLSGLNRILNGLDGVADGTFVVPDDLDQRATARLMAIVVAPRRTPGSILADLRRQVDPLFLPRRVICVDALPRNELGKLPRQALLAMVARLDAPA